MEKNKYIVIYAVLGILFIICCYIWLTFSINSKYVQFSLNISASILSIILTLSIVDNLIKKSEEEKSKPLRSAMYEEIRFFIVTFINFWQDINIATSEKHSAIDIKQLFENKKFSEMFLRLNLDKSPNVTPQTNWWYWISKESENFSNLIDKILNRYLSILDPEIFKNLHYLGQEDYMLKGLRELPGLKAYDERMGFYRPRYLAAYLPKTDQEYFDSIINVYNWCKNEYKMLSESGYDLFEPHYTDKLTTSHFDSRLTDQEIYEQNQKFNKQIGKI